MASSTPWGAAWHVGRRLPLCALFAASCSIVLLPPHRRGVGPAGKAACSPPRAAGRAPSPQCGPSAAAPAGGQWRHKAAAAGTAGTGRGEAAPCCTGQASVAAQHGGAPPSHRKRHHSTHLQGAAHNPRCRVSLSAPWHRAATHPAATCFLLQLDPGQLQGTLQLLNAMPWQPGQLLALLAGSNSAQHNHDGDSAVSNAASTSAGATSNAISGGSTGGMHTTTSSSSRQADATGSPLSPKCRRNGYPQLLMIPRSQLSTRFAYLVRWLDMRSWV
jgi:hypothetical protein